MHTLKVGALLSASMILVLAQSDDAASAPVYLDTVTVNSTTYDVSYVTGSFVDNETLLEAQVWWQNTALSNQFALSSSAFDAINGVTWLFAHQDLFTPNVQSTANISGVATTVALDRNLFVSPDHNSWAYMVAQEATAPAVPVPSGLPLILSGIVGLACLRRRGRRA